MRNTRRQFVKKIFAGLVCVGSGLKAIIVRSESEILSPVDKPPMPKLPRKFGTTSMNLTGADDIADGKWHHFIYHKVGSLEETHIDGMDGETISIPIALEISSFLKASFLKGCDIKNYRKDQVGCVTEEEFWFRKNSNLEKYNIINDLVTSMNMNDKKYPGQEFRYFIHCNYSGLGWLDAYGQLEGNEYEPDLNRGYKHVLRISNITWHGVEGCSRFLRVGWGTTQKADITLLCCPEKQCYGKTQRNYVVVTNRYFNVDRSERGKALMELV